MSNEMYYKGFFIKKGASMYTVSDKENRLCWEAQQRVRPNAEVTATAYPLAFRIEKDARDWIDRGCPLPKPLVLVLAYTREEAEQQLLNAALPRLVALAR